MNFYIQVYNEDGDLIRKGAPFARFRDALVRARSTYCFGQFHIECPDNYTPTRDEQLLIAPKERKPRLSAKQKQLLDTL